VRRRSTSTFQCHRFEDLFQSLGLTVGLAAQVHEHHTGSNGQQQHESGVTLGGYPVVSL